MKNCPKIDLLLSWLIIRIPLIAIVIFFLKDKITTSVVTIFEGNQGLPIINKVIFFLFKRELLQPKFLLYFFSTLHVRTLLFFFCTITLALILLGRNAILGRRLDRYWLITLSWASCFFILFYTGWRLGDSISSAFFKSVLITIVFAINTLPDNFWLNLINKPTHQRLAKLSFILLPGISEVFLTKPFTLWAIKEFRLDHLVFSNLGKIVPIFLSIPLIFALTTDINNSYLVRLGQVLNSNPAVKTISKGEYNLLDFNAKERLLYAINPVSNRLLAYNVDALEDSPILSKEKIGHAQGFSFNPDNHEIYVYNADTNNLLYLDASTLETKRHVEIVGGVSPGDSWLTWDSFSDNIFIASEANQKLGHSFVVVNRRTGKVLDEQDLEPGNILLNPNEPLLYMTYFRRMSELQVYDTQKRDLVRSLPTDKNVDRMAFLESRNELLVASPVKSRILRYDAKTLAFKGTINSIFGIRTLAFDKQRNLLLGGSLVNNMVAVIDMNNQMTIAQYYLGPWLRTISLDVEAGIAYVSSHDAIYRLDYLSTFSARNRPQGSGSE